MQKNCGRILTKQEEGNLEKRKNRKLEKSFEKGINIFACDNSTQ